MIETIEAPVEVKTVQDVLKHAALYIEEHGWVQGKYRDVDTGAVCASRAISMVSGSEDVDWNQEPLVLSQDPRFLLWRDAEKRFSKTIGQPPIAFNDAPHRTGQEVIDALRQAAG